MEIMAQNHIITGGIYLVINPAMERDLLLGRLATALTGGIQVIQIWNNWLPGANKLGLIEDVYRLCQPYGVPVLINQEWVLLCESRYLDGVHFDDIPLDYELIKQDIGRPFIAGITCSGNLDKVRWAEQNGLHYISFCSMFPSPSAGHCDIVMPATVKAARLFTAMPIFVSGGITPQNIISLKKETPFDGVAVISGIMSADRPEQKVKQYQDALSIPQL
jgi:thiamine-phosphate pyrophosphorylase